MPPSWPPHTILLGLGSLVTVGAVLGPIAFPRAPAPQVTHQALPGVGARPTREAAPKYPRTNSVTPLISGRLNLNTATQEQIEALPGVGPALAQRIMAARPLRSITDLDQVKGIGPRLLEKLTPLVSF